MASVAVNFVLVAIVVFGLIARLGDLPRLLGAWWSKKADRAEVESPQAVQTRRMLL